jgi:hypothetical protein
MTADANVLVDYLRDKEEAIRFLESSSYSFSISVVSITELYAGLRNSRELLELQEFIASLVIHPVDEKIAALAGKYLNQYAKSHNVGIADALIADRKGSWRTGCHAERKALPDAARCG